MSKSIAYLKLNNYINPSICLQHLHKPSDNKGKCNSLRTGSLRGRKKIQRASRDYGSEASGCRSARPLSARPARPRLHSYSASSP